MAKSQQTFNKSEKEKKRRKKKQEKAERREQRKLEKAEAGKVSFEDLIRYVDEDGNLTTEKPDPAKKKKINAADIQLGVPSRESEAFDPVRRGRVNFFNNEKGFGFISDMDTRESVFVHVNNVNEPIAEGDKVTFEVEMGPKGASAMNVSIAKSPVKTPKPAPAVEKAPEAIEETKDDTAAESKEEKSDTE
jgi:cold shock CspA family protein